MPDNTELSMGHDLGFTVLDTAICTLPSPRMKDKRVFCLNPQPHPCQDGRRSYTVFVTFKVLVLAFDQRKEGR